MAGTKLMLPVALMLLSVAHSSAQYASLDELLRPEEVAEPDARTAIALDQRVPCKSGMHEGHEVLDVTLPNLGGVPYRIRYNLCFDREAHPGMVECWPREGLSGLGLDRPTSPNFYSGSFIDVLIDGQSLGPYLAQVEHREYAGRDEVGFVWDTPHGAVHLALSGAQDDDRLLVRGRVQPGGVRSRIEVKLQCFPGSFSEPRERWITTATREVPAGQTVTLDPGEFWLAYWDKLSDEATDPERSAGPCALAYSPLQIQRARVEVGSYAITTTLRLFHDVSDFHLALWEFPDRPNAEALSHLRNITGDIPAPRAGDVVVDAPPLTLAQNGKPAAAILLAADARPGMSVAADELREHIYEMSDAFLPMGPKAPDDRNRIILRVDEALTDELSREGFRLRTSGRDVLIEGGGDAGVLYGVYELLETLGVRWVLPGPLGDVIPRLDTVRVPELDTSQKPDFALRWVGRGTWCLRNKGNYSRDPSHPGFNIQPGIYHSQYRLLPHEELFPEHPEYFALYQGERCEHRDAKPCTSNPEVVRVVADNMREMLDADPSIDMISLSYTDGSYYCECPDCVALDEPDCPHDQERSRRTLLFYNAVAEALARTHPDVKILAGAYHVYNRPPKDRSIEADPHLSVVVCHYTDYCSMHSVADATCPRNAEYRKLLDEWSALMPGRLYFYEYYYTDGFRNMPCFLVPAIRSDIPYFHRQGYGGLYTQWGHVWTTYLNYYVAARLLWDVDTDVDALLEDLYARFFVEAAEPMSEYYAAYQEALQQTDQHLCTCSLSAQRNAAIFTSELLAECRGHLERAKALARDPLVVARLEKVEASQEYAERMAEHARLRRRAEQETDIKRREELAAEALEAIETLHDDVSRDRARFDGVSSPGSYHWRFDLRTARNLAKRVGALPGTRGASLAARWLFRKDPENAGDEGRWFDPGLAEDEWTPIEVGQAWEKQGHTGYDGYAWYRCRFTPPAEAADRELLLYFGQVDAGAWVYLDGELLGKHEGWDEPFHFGLKPGTLQPEQQHQLTVRVHDSASDGGIIGEVLLLSPRR